MSIYKFSFIGLLFIIFSTSCIAQYAEPKPITSQKVLKVFIKKHLDYPDKALQQKTQGTVKINFTANKNGEIIDYNIIQSVSYEIDSSALSIFKLILWNPATSLGKPVTGESEFELKYSIKSFQKLARKRGYKHIIPPFTPVDTSLKIYTKKQLDTLPKVIPEHGLKSIYDLIYSKLIYPETALKLALTGKVELMFIIETNGLPSNIIAEKHLGGGCTEEAIKIIESLKWNPGIKNGIAVRTSYRISINFNKAENRDGHIPNQQGSGI